MLSKLSTNNSSSSIVFCFQCLTHTHHLGIDTQLFILSPILILILWKWPKIGAISLLSVAVFSTGARFYVTVAHKLSNYVYFGASYVDPVPFE